MTELSINTMHYVNRPYLARYLSSLRLIFSLLICIACPKIDKRIVRRNGVTYEQDTRNIGSSQNDRQSDGPQPDPTPMSQEQGLSPNHVSHDPIEIRNPQSLHETNQISQDINADNKPAANEQPKYQPRPQKFECPRCGQEKIVGVNGSRRWCLNCLTEWPTADAFLAEVNAGGRQDFEQPNRHHLQSRFLNILARLDEPELAKVKTWLDMLEAQLDLAEDTDHGNEKGTPIQAISVPEYA